MFFSQDRFTASPQHIDAYRRGGMTKANELWRSWRSKMKKKYITPLGNNMEMIRQNNPPYMTADHWQTLLVGHYFTEYFAVCFILNENVH